MTADTALPPVEGPTAGGGRRSAVRAVSPLDGYAGQFTALATEAGGAVRIAERPFLTQLTLRADPSSASADLGAVLPGPLPAPGLVAGSRWPLVLGLGPDEWLVLASPEERQDLEGKLRASLGDDGAVADVSGQRTAIALSGPKSRELLAKGCAIDLHPKVFSAGCCAQTYLAHAQVILVASGATGPQPGEPQEILILARSSFARYVADWLLDAAAEYRAAECRAAGYRAAAGQEAIP